VLDQGNKRVQTFSSSGAHQDTWQFDSFSLVTSGIAVDQSGIFYVSDPSEHTIMKFSSAGALEDTFGTPGTSGSGNDQFSSPQGVAVSGDGATIFVADRGNVRIQRFSSAGTPLDNFGQRGTGPIQPDQLGGPLAVAVNGAVVVLDVFLARIMRFTTSGDHLANIDGGLRDPVGVAVDTDDNIYVTDSNHGLQKFTPDGTFVTTIGSIGGGEEQFFKPHGIAVDAAGNVFVADIGNNCVVVFAPTDSVAAQSVTSSPGANRSGTAPQRRRKRRRRA
jgi:DNA-binding beta-propeller fold protein YncE